MTTLRDQIAAKFHATWDLDEHDVETFVAELLAMWRDEAPPSDGEWSKLLFEHEREFRKLSSGTALTMHEHAISFMRATWERAFACGIASGEAERAELQRLLDCAQKRIGELHDALKAKVLELPVEQMRQAERERDAAREELRGARVAPQHAVGCLAAGWRAERAYQRARRHRPRHQRRATGRAQSGGEVSEPRWDKCRCDKVRLGYAQNGQCKNCGGFKVRDDLGKAIRAAELRGELKGLEWARGRALSYTHAFNVERAVAARITELKKGEKL